ncbi:Two-component sensor histidine kinase, contains HisKA and HATPase domains [Chitinophaga niabensis]|uniref:histidine kinase n=2 Tax=Chitinophaga niabensis TaxID=536979 RepID=A0A1N6FKP6_9BACT|nr:Two-component sensor histidine kinase, contains HisKA and HATPase domains [Chitinophaga niabensis]
MALLAIHHTTTARQTNPKTALLERLAQTGQDTARVHALYAIADYLWHKDPNYDSIISYANRAFVLSRQLKYEEGYIKSAVLLCKSYTKINEFDKAKSLLPQMNKEQQIHLLILIGEGYLFQPGLKKPVLDTAFSYFNQALQASEKMGSVKWRHESLIALAKYYFSSDQIPKGKEAFLRIIRDFQQTKEIEKEAHIWSELGKYMPDTDSTFNDQMWAHGTALKLYYKLKDTSNLISVLQDISAINMNHSNFDSARAQTMQVLEWRRLTGNKKAYSNTYMLGWLSYATGDMDEALKWLLITEKNAAEYNIFNETNINTLLGLIYSEDGQHQKALSYFLNTPKASGYILYFLARKITEEYIHLGQPEKALAFMRDFETKNPPKNPDHQESIAAARGDIYAALNKPAQARQYYLEMVGLDNEAQKYRGREILPRPFSVSGSEAYYKIARFYADQREYAAAAPYLATAARINAFSGNRFYTANNLRNIRFLQYVVDSATGNYKGALEHHRQYTALNDSLSNIVKIRQLHQLQVQYETEKKEQAILQKDGQIKTLEQNNRLRQANLKQAQFIRNISIIATLLLLALAGLLYRQYRQKQLANQLITIQNTQLQHLLKEKEWLLKEVHHRVKNNLHTVICLLESQAAFLENDALKAIESSQHRIYAMSLIHQKLYQVDNVKTIEMNRYLPEFVQYLKDSFGITDKIYFRTEVEPVSLDVSVAIPIALILNEAVTNSIKYAFPGNSKGRIEVNMYHEAGEIVLEISDNGIGIDKNIKDKTLNSLGVELMKGLSEDINGQIEFANDEGTKITVRFAADSPFYPALQSEKEAPISA